MKKRSEKPARRSSAEEIAQLRARLEEAEGTLEAIRTGQVEALVVHGEDGPRIFTLEGADHRYRRLVETMNEGALLVSEEGVVLYANAAFALMVGERLEATIGRPLIGLVDAASRPACEALLRVARTEAAADELVLRTVRGRRVPVLLSTSPNGVDGPGIAVIVSSLAPQKRSEEIVASERLASSILEQAAEAIVVCDPDGIIIRASSSARELARRPLLREQVRVAFPLVTEGAHPAERALAGEIARGVEATLELPGAPAMNVLCAAAPLRNDGTVLGCVLTVVDVTRQKRDEAERSGLLDAERAARVGAERARAEAEASNRSKDEFLATVSHELRTPLNAIVGWSRLMSGGTLPEPRQAHAVEVIRRNADAQARLIEDLLDVSRIVSGKMRLDIRPVDLATVIRAVVDSVRPALEAKQITLTQSFGAAEMTVTGDADRLQQVVWNLLSNAAKFTPRGGTVGVALERSGDSVEVLITDNGRGIEAAFLPHVFERFRQADGTISRQHGGLGLGLAISRHLVELHGGTIEVTSEGAEKGARFAVRLPRDATLTAAAVDSARGPVASVAPTSEANLTGVHVLVVEDDDDSRELLVSILSRSGARTTSMRSGHDALDALDALEGADLPDVLVADIGMPGLDGYAFIRKVRELPDARARRLPALALTAYARAEDRRRALEVGFQLHLAKPVDARDLAVSVASLARYVKMAP